MFLPKFLGGGQGFQEKLPGGGPPILGFIAFLLTSFSKICLGGCCFIPPPPPPHPPLCASMTRQIKMLRQTLQ
jgi:hypothetical protein